MYSKHLYLPMLSELIKRTRKKKTLVELMAHRTLRCHSHLYLIPLSHVSKDLLGEKVISKAILCLRLQGPFF